MKLSGKLLRTIVGVVVVAVALGVGLYVLLGGNSTKKVTAQFTSAVGIYKGTPLDILGIKVGQVTAVHPKGGYVQVEMTYDKKYDVPKNAIAAIVTNSLVSDRYIQLAPAYKGKGAVMADDATIPSNRTAAPAELDQIYAALDKLSTALGPKGANDKGALSELVNVGAADLKGNGTALGNSISKLSKAAGTLADSSGNLFGTVKNLKAFTQALVDSDSQVRRFESLLATVSTQLAGERQDLGTALHQLGVSLQAVGSFVKQNQSKIHTDLGGLVDISGVLVKEQKALDEILAVAPTALSNIVHLYQPNIGVLPTRSNLASLTNPGAICALLDPNLIPGLGKVLTGENQGPLGGLLNLVTGLTSQVLSTVKSACTSVLSGLSLNNLLKSLGLPTGLDLGDLGKALDGILTPILGGLGTIIVGG